MVTGDRGVEGIRPGQGQAVAAPPRPHASLHQAEEDEVGQGRGERVRELPENLHVQRGEKRFLFMCSGEKRDGAARSRGRRREP